MLAEILTIPEVASLLKVGEKAQLPAFRVRGQWHFKRTDLDAWIESQKSAVGNRPAEPGGK